MELGSGFRCVHGNDGTGRNAAVELIYKIYMALSAGSFHCFFLLVVIFEMSFDCNSKCLEYQQTSPLSIERHHPV